MSQKIPNKKNKHSNNKFFKTKEFENIFEIYTLCRRLPTPVFLGFPCGSTGKESACNVGDLGSIPRLGRSPGKGKGYPFQYSGLENSMDCIVLGVTNSWTRLSDFHFTSEDRDEVKIQKKKKWRISTHILVNMQNIIDIKKILKATRLKLLITYKETSNQLESQYSFSGNELQCQQTIISSPKLGGK